MNNAEYEKEIETLIPELERLNEEAIPIARDIIGSTVLLVDLGFSPLLKRSLQLTDGFIAMISCLFRSKMSGVQVSPTRTVLLGKTT